MTFEEHLEKLKNKEQYSFSRWGDGEWACLLNKQGQNCDRHIYFTDMGKRLREILESKPNYYIGLQNLAYRLHKDVIDKYTNGYKLNWVKSDIFHNASSNKRLNELFEVLKDRNVILVGGGHLKGFNDYSFVEIPRLNCWLSYKDTLEKLLNIQKDDVVLFCASMMSNVLIDDLHSKATLMDLGSVLDPYVNVKSRKYHFNLNL